MNAENSGNGSGIASVPHISPPVGPQKTTFAAEPADGIVAIAEVIQPLAKSGDLQVRPDEAQKATIAGPPVNIPRGSVR